jgi:hypothetical protein
VRAGMHLPPMWGGSGNTETRKTLMVCVALVRWGLEVFPIETRLSLCQAGENNVRHRSAVQRRSRPVERMPPAIPRLPVTRARLALHETRPLKPEARVAYRTLARPVRST